MKKTALVLTTIQEPTTSLKAMMKMATENDIAVYIAGDKKTPVDFELKGANYLSPRQQLDLFPKLASLMPWNHYARKNLAYIQAISEGATTIRETDDDNSPLPDFTDFQLEDYPVYTLDTSEKWVNIYQFFTELNVWPRGFSLSTAAKNPDNQTVLRDPEHGNALIFQGLVDGHPDIDAVYRLVNGNITIQFEGRKIIKLSKGQWCPFNSQNTLFRYQAFPLLYLPSGASFRLTDIWRSFVAQRCLWEMKEGIAHHYPTVVQDRNVHDFYKDFIDEMPGYSSHDHMIGVLEDLNLGNDMIQNLLTCYKALVEEKFLPESELLILDSWISELLKHWTA